MAELLAVVGIMVLLMAFIGPMIRSIKGTRDIVGTAHNIAGTLEQARAFAMANNTYTWVGFFEEDGVSMAAADQGKAGVGRVVTCIFTSRDGRRYLDKGVKDLAHGNANLAVVGKMAKYDGAHLVSSGSNRSLAVNANDLGPATGGSEFEVTDYTLGAIKLQGGFPIGTSPKYTFTRLIEFNPLGEANFAGRALDYPPAQWIGIGLQRANGNVSENKPAANLLVEGLTGRVHVFVP